MPDRTRELPKNFSDLRAEVDGAGNKVRLTSKYATGLVARGPGEYIENAIAVLTSKDPANYNYERDRRHEEMVVRLGEWAIDREMISA
jgi:hypothetical protein